MLVSLTPEELVVDNFDFKIAPGITQAIVGPTGSGKTTLIRLLLRFHVPKSGNIFLDGNDISKLNLKDLRSSISLVTQTITLFPGSVLQNIAYGSKESSESEIIDAAKVAEIHDFIESLPDGYETQIGEGGHKLSGGQRQRISIARAVLKDAPILVLDEATSSVDNETEEALQKSLDFISKDRTTIVIAHRLSTIRHSDSIIVLDGGKVIESGKHEQLMIINQATIAFGMFKLELENSDSRFMFPSPIKHHRARRSAWKIACFASRRPRVQIPTGPPLFLRIFFIPDSLTNYACSSSSYACDYG